MTGDDHKVIVTRNDFYLYDTDVATACTVTDEFVDRTEPSFAEIIVLSDYYGDIAEGYEEFIKLINLAKMNNTFMDEKRMVSKGQALPFGPGKSLVRNKRGKACSINIR